MKTWQIVITTVKAAPPTAVNGRRKPDRDGALGFRQCSEPEREGIRAMGAKRGKPG